MHHSVKGLQLWERLRVKQQLHISLKVVIYAEGAAALVTPLSSLKGLTRQLAAGRFRKNKTKQKLHVLQKAYLHHVDFFLASAAKCTFFFGVCDIWRGSHVCPGAMCLDKNPLCCVRLCCIIRCMKRWMMITLGVTHSLSLSHSAFLCYVPL